MKFRDFVRKDRHRCRQFIQIRNSTKQLRVRYWENFQFSSGFYFGRVGPKTQRQFSERKKKGKISKNKRQENLLLATSSQKCFPGISVEISDRGCGSNPVVEAWQTRCDSLIFGPCGECLNKLFRNGHFVGEYEPPEGYVGRLTGRGKFPERRKYFSQDANQEQGAFITWIRLLDWQHRGSL